MLRPALRVRVGRDVVTFGSRGEVDEDGTMAASGEGGCESVEESVEFAGDDTMLIVGGSEGIDCVGLMRVGWSVGSVGGAAADDCGGRNTFESNSPRAASERRGVWAVSATGGCTCGAAVIDG